MIYRYSAFEGNKRIDGKIQANDLKECESILISRGLRIIKIEEESNFNINELVGKKFKDSELYIFLHQLNILIKSKIAVPESIKILSEEYKGYKKQSIDRIYKKLVGGISLAEAMNDEEYFPGLIKNMVKVGEESSKLSEILENLSKYYLDKTVFKKKLYSTLTYPIILFVVTLIIVNFLVINILPTFSEIFKNSGAELPLITKILINTSNFIRENFIILMAFIVILVAMFYIYAKTKKGKYRLEKILLRSKLYRNIHLQNFINIMNFLLASKVVMSDSLKIASNSVSNLHLKEEIEMAITKLYSGVSLSEALNKSKFLDNITLSLIKVGEKSSSMDEVFNSLKNYYENKIEMDSRRFLALIEPIIIILLSFFVGYIVFSIALPMFDISSYIS